MVISVAIWRVSDPPPLGALCWSVWPSDVSVCHSDESVGPSGNSVMPSDG